ncbi:Glyoxalase/Bleomycin resistance protein/Dihydroxybiphenyl dioxygenase [Xylariaceae sp. FL0594]|nr:Glyoxalase/Bleomycin resistance protein/Dihydroxybiphenyl dioxygenase [Xylariaceae sp. FL0594]
MAADSDSKKVLSPVSMAHVVLKTADLPKMSAFYKTFLGARASWESDQLSFLTYDDEHHRIALAQIPGLQPKIQKSVGMDHIAFTYSSMADLLTAYKQRKALGIVPIWATNHGPSTSLYYEDPDGNRIETQVDNFDTAEEANAFMNSPEFAKNPVGADFDPEDLIRRIEGGEPESELKKRPDVGPRAPDTIPLLR